MKADIEKLKAWFKSSLEHPASVSWRREERVDHNFYDGEQFTSKDRTELTERGQPIIMVNKIFAKVNNLLGAQRLLRARIGAKGRTPKDTQVGAAINDIFRMITDRSDYSFEESEAFDEGIKAGVGWLETLTKVDEMNQTEVIIAQEEARNLYIDPFSKKSDLSDAAFIARSKWADLDDIIELFPKKETEIKGLVQSDATSFSLSGLAVHGPRSDYDMESVVPQEFFYSDQKRRRIRPIELWYRTTQEVYFNPTTNVIAESLDDIRLYAFDPVQMDGNIMAETLNEEELLPLSGYQKRKQKVTRVAFFCGDVLFSDYLTPHTHPTIINKFPFFPFFCFRKSSGEPYGYVRQVRDVQREINKRRSKALHILNTVRVIADADAVEDVDAAREEIARPDAWIVKTPGKELIIESNINMANTQFNVMNQSAGDMQDIMGIFDEALGKETNARSGVAIGRRMESSNQNSVRVFDNLRRTRLLIGKYILGLILQHYTNEQIINITDEQTGTSKEIPINKDMGGGTILNDIKTAVVDVIVDELPPTGSAQDEQFIYLIEAVKSGLPIPPDLVVEASNIRNKDKIIAALRSRVQQQPSSPLSEEGNPAVPALPVAQEGV